ncbi:MAG: TetR/AcrR family transcriptional regulator [Halobacteria archaeon]|nr:TetR/AcrR family transcriptional regulator [Halobacteria archaeon]
MVTQRSDAETTHEEIMEATYRALCKHGYADLTMQKIADEFDKSKSLIHYHYDTKQDLLVALLDFMLDRFDEYVDIEEIESPRERLKELVKIFIMGTESEKTGSEGHWAFHTALLELRAQAPHNEAYKEQLTKNYDFMREIVVGIIEEGIEKGEFRDVDPERTADFILGAINGGRIHHITLEHDDLAESVHRELIGYIDTNLGTKRARE